MLDPGQMIPFAMLAPAVTPGADMHLGAELLRMLLSLAAVVAMIFVAAWVSRRLQRGGRPGSRRLRCVESLAVGSRERVLLIDADGKRLLVGVGQGGLRTLHVFDGAAPVEADEPAPLAAVPNVAQLVRRWKVKS